MLDRHGVDLAAREAALARIAAAASVDDTATLDAQLFGKRGTLGRLKTRLGSLTTVDERKAAGRELHDASTAVTAALATRREELAAAARARSAP